MPMTASPAMGTALDLIGPNEIDYPCSDGLPMSDNTIHDRAITGVSTPLRYLLEPRGVFVAVDILWYLTEGDPKDRISPDVLIAFGVPAGDKSSYFQWIEGIVPQVVFEMVSPNNTGAELSRKYGRYLELGVEEYYVYDPGYDPPYGKTAHLRLDVSRRSTHGFQRRDGEVVHLDDLISVRSPRLDLSFAWGDDGYLDLVGPDGRPLLAYDEAMRAMEAESARAEAESARAEDAIRRAGEAEARLAALRAAGVDVDGLLGSANPAD